MSVRVIRLPDFEGEEARGVVGDFGPFNIEMVNLEVFRPRPHFIFWKRGKWVTLHSTFLDAHEAVANGIDLETWTHDIIERLKRRELLDRAERKARANFYSNGA